MLAAFDFAHMGTLDAGQVGQRFLGDVVVQSAQTPR